MELKTSEVGPIPHDWNVMSLGELGEVLIGLTYKPSDVRPHGTLVLRSSNIQNDALAFEDNVFVSCEIPDRIMVQPGDVLICVRNGSRSLIGKTVLLDDRTRGMTFGAFMAVYRSPFGPLVNYLFQSQVLKRQIAEHLGATINQITNKSLRSFAIPISPHAEEREAIVRALTDVDTLLERLDQLIAKRRDLRIAVMQQLLSGRTRLPGFSDAWQERVLGEHVRFLKHGANPRADLLPEGRIRYLHYGDVHTSLAPFLDLRTARMPRLPEAKARRLDRLEDGDVVFVDASEDLTGVGKSVEIGGASGLELVSGLHTIAARFDKHVLADGFKGYLQFCPPFRDQLARLAQGTKVFATTRQHIASVVMKLPGVDEQSAIARVLSESERESLALEALRKKTSDLKLAMSQELLTGHTRFNTTGGANG